MKPEYVEGDMLVSKEVAPETIKVGDNVVYKGEKGDMTGLIVTHKVIEVREENGKYYFTTKGTANEIEDPEINEDQIYGKIIYKMGFLSFLSRVMLNIYAYYILATIMGLLVSIQVVKIIYDNDDEEKEWYNWKKNKKKSFSKIIKKSIKPKNLIFLIIILSANTFAWFVYVKEVHTDINVKVRAWNVVLTNSESEVISTLNVDIKSAYPGMEEFLNETKAYNQGESKADLNYTILSINAFGNEIITSEKIISDGGTPTEDNPTSKELEKLIKRWN